MRLATPKRPVPTAVAHLQVQAWAPALPVVAPWGLLARRLPQGPQDTGCRATLDWGFFFPTTQLLASPTPMRGGVRFGDEAAPGEAADLRRGLALWEILEGATVDTSSLFPTTDVSLTDVSTNLLSYGGLRFTPSAAAESLDLEERAPGPSWAEGGAEEPLLGPTPEAAPTPPTDLEGPAPSLAPFSPLLENEEGDEEGAVADDAAPTTVEEAHAAVAALGGPNCLPPLLPYATSLPPSRMRRGGGLQPLPQVRYKPGLARAWRLLRLQFCLAWGLPWLRQRRFTNYVTQLAGVTGLGFVQMCLLSAGALIRGSGLLPTTEFHPGGIFVNGRRAPTPLLQVYKGDRVSVPPMPTGGRHRLPRWVGAVAPRPLEGWEVDALARVVTLWGEPAPTLAALAQPRSPLPFLTFRMYNWKYRH